MRSGSSIRPPEVVTVPVSATATKRTSMPATRTRVPSVTVLAWAGASSPAQARQPSPFHQMCSAASGSKRGTS
jgi:hypothetical protein